MSETYNSQELYEFDNGYCSKTRVFGIEDAIIGSKYPHAIDVDRLNGDVTRTVVALAQSPKGEGHDQFLTGITVTFDMTFSNKAWVEAERYRNLCFVSSMSTMHKGMKMNPAERCNEYVDQRVIDVVEELLLEYNEKPSLEAKLKVLYNLPSGYRLTAKMITNYRQLKTIYSQRKNHELPDWNGFCEWVKYLPYSELLITGDSSYEDVYGGGTV